MHMFGVDLGFAKTGVAVFELLRDRDELVHAEIVRSDVSKRPIGVAADDFRRCAELAAAFSGLLQRWRPSAVFLEVPHGGAQGSRANRCMGMATGWMAGVLQVLDIRCEVILPSRVEALLDIRLSPGMAKERGMAKAARTKWKKDRMEHAVRTEWPDFRRWPKPAEDAYDAAAAFMAGRLLPDEAGMYSTYRSLREAVL
jgi:hypothetical protein